DQRSDQARADAPRRGVAQLALVVLVREGDVIGAGKVLAEVVRSSSLQRLAIAHEAFKGQRVDGPWKCFGGGLLAGQHRNREPVFGDRAVVTEDKRDLVHRLLRVRVKRMSLLPPELAAA